MLDFANRLAEISELVNRSSGSHDSRRLLEQICRALNVSNGSYVAIGPHMSSGEAPFVVHTYSPLWHQHYFDAQYHRIDPLAGGALKTLLPVDWSTLARRFPKSQKVFQEAIPYDVGKFGITVPIRDQHGHRAIFSLSTTDSGQAWSKVRLELLPDLQSVAYLFHQFVTDASHLPTREIRLSPRQKDVLTLASQGLTCEDIADCLNISASTVRHYSETARFRLGAANVTQAVAMALSEELIFYR